jgi:hypothetical protein
MTPWQRTILVVGPAPELPEYANFRLIGPFLDDQAALEWLAIHPGEQVDVVLLRGSEVDHGALVSMLQRHQVTTILFPVRPLDV